MAAFQCLRCGECCSRLEKEHGGISLFPWEVHLFPREMVEPSLGLGEKPGCEGFKVFLYLYRGPGCIHFQGERCAIHDQRPLVCRSYPFRARKAGGKTVFVTSPECRALEGWPKSLTLDTRFEELDAAELVADLLSRFYKGDEAKWWRNERGEWVRIGRDKSSQ